jgi:uncharacterized protein YndB with AHSA1/START domain
MRPARPGRLTVRRVLPATVEEVYAAWTDPALMRTWLSPVGEAEVEADVHVGGELRVIMRGGGVRIEHRGRYLAVEPPHRLIFTWTSQYTGNQPSVVTVELSPIGGRTHLTLSHEQLPADAAGSHRGGWIAIVDRLAALLSEERSHPVALEESP